jgi:predicted nucleic acid-binding protein
VEGMPEVDTSQVTRAYLDTNVIIRLLTGDDPAKQMAARALFEAASSGTVELIVHEAVVAEAVYVLSSAQLYKVPRGRVAAMLTGLCLLPGVEVTNKPQVLSALALYAPTNLHFEDALIAAAMQDDKVQVIYSYDKHFDRVAGVSRREP